MKKILKEEILNALIESIDLVDFNLTKDGIQYIFDKK